MGESTLECLSAILPTNSREYTQRPHRAIYEDRHGEGPCLPIQGDVLRFLWPYAVRHAVYLMDPLRGLFSGEIPKVARQVSYSHLRVFGCQAA